MAVYEPSFPDSECARCRKMFYDYELESVMVNADGECNLLCGACKNKLEGGDFSEERGDEA